MTNSYLTPAPNLTTEQEIFCNEVATGTTGLCLTAVAGSGKTTTMVAAIRRLPPGTDVLACAYNSKTAKELTERLPAWVTTATLNALGHRAWAAYIGKRVSLDFKKLGSITSEICNLHEVPDLWITLRDLASKAKSSGLVPNRSDGSLPDTPASWEYLIDTFNIDQQEATVETLAALTREILICSIDQAKVGVIDFDDQLYMTAYFAEPAKQFRMVFVDEAQDLSPVQHKMLEKMIRPNGRLIVIGDPKQAIYGFRGADNNSMQKLSCNYNLTPLGLTVNFRCSQEVILEAQQYVPSIKFCDTAPVGEVVRREPELRDLVVPDSIILCRNVAPIVGLAFRFLRRGIIATVLGQDIGKQLIAVVKKFKASSLEEFYAAIDAWEADKIAVAEAKQAIHLKAWAEDMGETLRSIVKYTKAKTSAEFIAGMEGLFKDTAEGVTLSTIHRSKGLEWHTVFLLDAWRMPAKYAQRAADLSPASCGWMLEQETNLQYIATTRAKHTLCYINSADITTGVN